MTPSTRAVLNGIAYFLGLLVLCVVTAEIFLRFTLPEPQRYFIWPPNMHVVFEPNDEATPGITGPGHFKTNSLGLRSDEPLPDAERTIYVFGGSTAADVYLDQREAWVNRLQDLINGMSDQPRTWVGNFGRSSLASLHALLQFEFLVPTLPKADLFVVYAGVNDLQLALKSSYLPDMTREIHMDWTFSLQPSAEGFWGGLAITRFWKRIRDWWSRGSIGVTQTHSADGFITWRECRQSAPKERLVHVLPDLTPDLAEYRKNLNALVDYADKFGAPMVFVTQAAIWTESMRPEDEALLLAAGVGPNNVWCERKEYFAPATMARGLELFNQVMLDVCEKRKIACVDLGRRLAKSGEHFYDDMHFNEQGANAAAEIVAEAVSKLPR